MRKIAIPSNDQVTVADHFGRAAGFLVFTTDGDIISREYRRLEIPADASCGSEEGAPSKHALFLGALRDCDVVIAGGMGSHMLDTLTNAGLEVVFTDAQMATDAVEMCSKIEPVAGGMCSCMGGGH